MTNKAFIAVAGLLILVHTSLGLGLGLGLAATEQCCGRSANLVLDVDLKAKKIDSHKTLFFDEKICRAKSPADFGNAFVAIFADGKETLKMKTQLPTDLAFDHMDKNEITGGGSVAQTKFAVSLKLPECAKFAGSQIKFFNLKGELLAEGRL